MSPNRGPSPIRQKTYGEQGRRGPFSPRSSTKSPPFPTPASKHCTILASNPHCAQQRPASRLIVRNKSRVYPGGQHCAKYGISLHSSSDGPWASFDFGHLNEVANAKLL